ncbi:MAG: hypothetical protein ACRCTU_04385 [Zoogloea sp.]|uniref:hypothetical protein n=1 Tax=Zoogloea sp. TaxID=49181 RepID=UPI003F319FAA
MSPATFFRASLIAPLALPFLAIPFGLPSVFGLLFIALAFGGAQYAILAAYLYYAIGKKQSPGAIKKLALLAPVLFVPMQAIGWLALSYYDRLSNPNLGGIWEPLPVFAIYSLIIGYGYVGLILGIYWLLKKLALVTESTR